MKNYFALSVFSGSIRLEKSCRYSRRNHTIIFDSHLYLQVRLNDTIPVTIIYDTGADFLYLDEDYLKLNNLQNAFGKKE